MPVFSPYPTTHLDELLETLWTLEDTHRELVQRLERLITHLEASEIAYPLPLRSSHR